MKDDAQTRISQVIVRTEHADRRLDGLIRELFEVSWGTARNWIESGKIAIDGDVCLNTEEAIHAGATIRYNPRAPKPRPKSALDPKWIVYEDAHVVVVNKPSGISTVPYDENETGTLDEQVRNYLAKRAKQTGRAGKGDRERAALGVVHRIDKETSGLVVFTRTWLAKQSLSSQFRVHTVHRIYAAIVHGSLKEQTVRSHLVENRGDGLRGSRERAKARGMRNMSGGQEATTHIRPIEKLGESTLIACTLETGRTHQIRIHLSELGHPLLGERVYIRDFKGKPISAPRLMLHAKELGFTHPATQKEMRWESEPPADFDGVLRRLRHS